MRQGVWKPVLAVLAILCVIWASIYWLNREAESTGEREIERETSALALLFAEHAETTFRLVDFALKELRDEWSSRRPDFQESKSRYLKFLGNAVLNVAVIDKAGYIVFSNTLQSRDNTFVGAREPFLAHRNSREDKLYVGRPLKGQVTGRWSIHLSRPIFQHGQFNGVMVISVDPDYFVKFYQRAGLGRDGAARMIRDSGEVMARSSEQEKYIGTVIKPSPYADPGAPLEGSFRRKAQVDGVERLSSYRRLPEYGVTVVIGPGMEERMAAMRAHQRVLVGAGVMVSVLVLVIGGLVSANLRRVSSRHDALVDQYQDILSLQQKLLGQAYKDSLTGLHNRRYLDETLPRELARAKREGTALVLVMMDLDHFKKINDQFGHAAGDLVLTRFAFNLTAHARESDIVCRLGGEEFLMVMLNTSLSQAQAKIDSLRQDVADSAIEHDGHSIRVTFSAGMTEYPLHGSEVDTLIRRADEALYRAKHGGRNRVVVA